MNKAVGQRFSALLIRIEVLAEDVTSNGADAELSPKLCYLWELCVALALALRCHRQALSPTSSGEGGIGGWWLL